MNNLIINADTARDLSNTINATLIDICSNIITAAQHGCNDIVYVFKKGFESHFTVTRMLEEKGYKVSYRKDCINTIDISWEDISV